MSKRYRAKSVTGKITEQRRVDYFNASNVKTMPLERKRSLTKALNDIYKESRDKEYLIRTSNSAHSTADAHYEKVLFAHPNKKEED